MKTHYEYVDPAIDFHTPYYTIVVYQSPNSVQWYWRMKAPNGRIVADGSEGYKTKQGATRAAIKLASHPIRVISLN